jgi:hypothetical protein
MKLPISKNPVEMQGQCGHGEGAIVGWFLGGEGRYVEVVRRFVVY